MSLLHVPYAKYYLYLINYLAEVLRCDQDLKPLSNYSHVLLQTLHV